jgi:hypothetical protein
MIDGNTTVHDLLGRHPETFTVFLAHGMCADCQADPPPVPISHFAMKHCEGNLDELLGELRSAMK